VLGRHAVLASAIPGLSHAPDPLLITVGVVLILIYGNLRGLKEAGSYFALPTYFYIVMMSATIIFGSRRRSPDRSIGSRCPCRTTSSIITLERRAPGS